MEKAIDIKRRAQRCVQSGDLDGALREYGRLVEGPDADPYNFVLLADLLYKKGEPTRAAERYLEAVQVYQRGLLYKNAIAVCKKMLRLNLSAGPVLKHLAELHAADGLAGEAALYFTQYAEAMARAGNPAEAAVAFRQAFEHGREQVRLLEQLAEVLVADGQTAPALSVLSEAAGHHRERGHVVDAARCESRARELDPSFVPGRAVSVPAAPVASVEPETPVFESHAAAPVEASATPEVGFERSRVFAAPEPVAVESIANDASVEPTPVSVAPLELESVHATTATEASVAEVAPIEPEADEPVTFAAPTADKHDVEHLLTVAQEQFRTGQREDAARTLVQAALGYEGMGQLDSAATILRSLGRAAQAPLDVLEHWYRNCEQRADHAEAAQVAAELGERAIQNDDLDTARTWFGHALRCQPGHELARRRMTRLGGPLPEITAPAPPAPEHGRVEVAMGRSESLTTDLESLLSEFQRGVEAQLEGDAQGHYDLGMAYRDMGLHEQAIEAFRAAAQDATLAPRAFEMVGRCQAAAGSHEAAIEAFEHALGLGTFDAEGQVELRLEMAQSLSAIGDLDAAIVQLENADAAMPGRADVAERLAELRGFRKAA